MSETRPPYEKLDACEDFGNSHITGHPVWVMFTVRTRRDGKCPDALRGCVSKSGAKKFDNRRVYLVDEREIPSGTERTTIYQCNCGILFT